MAIGVATAPGLSVGPLRIRLSRGVAWFSLMAPPNITRFAIAIALAYANPLQAQPRLEAPGPEDASSGDVLQGAEDDLPPEDEVVFGATAVVRRPLPAANPLDPTAAGTTTSGRDAVATELGMPELLLRLPGVDVRQTGSTGAAAFVALRGASSTHTTFLLGDLPLGSADMGAFDLALLNPMGFGSVEVYRGGAPAWLDSGAVGGVVRLVPPRGEYGQRAAEVALSAGSFRQWRLRGGTTVRGRHVRLATAASVDGAANDFPFADDNGTALDPSDDTESRRVNAQTRGGFALGHLEVDVGDDGAISTVVYATSRRGGDPGPAQATAEHTRRADVRLGAVAAYDHRRPWGKLQVAASSNLHQQEVSDPLQEIGLDRNENRDRFWDVATRLAGVAHVLDWLDATLVGSFRHLAFEPNNRRGIDLPRSVRNTLAATAELRAHGHVGERGIGLELRGSARLEYQRTRANGLRLGRTTVDRSKAARPTFRLAGAVAPLPWLSLVASVASGTRFPTFLELFGDASTIVANPGLAPEQSRSIDAGLVLRGGTARVRGTFEARFFDLRIEQLVRAVPTSQYTVVFQNEEHARNRGVEAGGELRLLSHLRLAGSATVLHTDTGRGVQLNWRPRLQAQLQPELHTGRLLFGISDATFFAGILHRGAYFNDPANLVRVSGRTWLSIGVRVDLAVGLSFGFTVRDLFDRRGQDFLGFPLPGRRFALELKYRNEM